MNNAGKKNHEKSAMESRTAMIMNINNNQSMISGNERGS
tara:strand:+ start:388 stop:504 length:117 start_codon:yes stop_codon:yes gene_type:complete